MHLPIHWLGKDWHPGACYLFPFSQTFLYISRNYYVRITKFWRHVSKYARMCFVVRHCHPTAWWSVWRKLKWCPDCPMEEIYQRCKAWGFYWILLLQSRLYRKQDYETQNEVWGKGCQKHTISEVRDQVWFAFVFSALAHTGKQWVLVECLLRINE